MLLANSATAFARAVLCVAVAVYSTVTSRGILQVTPNFAQLVILINVCWSECAKQDYSCDMKVDPGLSFIPHNYHSVVAKSEVYHSVLLELAMAYQQ